MSSIGAIFVGCLVYRLRNIRLGGEAFSIHVWVIAKSGGGVNTIAMAIRLVEEGWRGPVIKSVARAREDGFVEVAAMCVYSLKSRIIETLVSQQQNTPSYAV